jgi:hypothetical protein
MNMQVRLLAAGSVLIATACSQRVEVLPVTSVGPALVVEQFLRAANSAAANDTSGVSAMGRLWGTKDGLATEQMPLQEMQQRMLLTASILRHDDSKIVGEQLVPGRISEAKQLNVELTQGPRKVVVPFFMVLSKGDRWLVERIDLEVITKGR